MKRIAQPVLAACVCLALAGCVELERKQVGLKASVENPLEIGAKDLPLSLYFGGLGDPETGADSSYYRVGKTDTLVSIAEEFYGSRAYAERVYRTNEGLLRRAGGLARGMILELPRLREETEPIETDARP
ncbi:MAG: hypothetical protein ACYTAN_11520 [Planctomycetota bacterium]